MSRGKVKPSHATAGDNRNDPHIHLVSTEVAQ